MTWWIWLIVVGIAAAAFGIGVYATLVMGPRRPIDLDRIHGFIGVVLIVVALIVVVDIVYLQVDYRRFAERSLQADSRQIACNRETLKALMQISTERRQVDEQAKDFDVALKVWLQSPRSPADLKLVEDALDNVSNARIAMMRVYDSVAFPNCQP